jgi:phage terminase small subunit
MAGMKNPLKRVVETTAPSPVASVGVASNTSTSENVASLEPVIKNPRHKIFADAILGGMNASRAVVHAGYNSGNPGSHGAQMRAKPEIAAYLTYHQSNRTEEAKLSQERWIKELSAIAFSNVDDFTRLNEDGDLEVDFSQATREQLSAVQGVKVKKRKIYSAKGDLVGEEHHSEFRLWDKLRANELLGKNAGFLRDEPVKVVVDVADRLLSARQRVMGRVTEVQSGEDA